MSDAPQLLIEALRDRLNRALLRAEQAEAERDALRARWDGLTAFVARDPSWAAQAARMAELEAPDA